MKNKYLKNLALIMGLASTILSDSYSVDYISPTKHKQLSKQYKHKNKNITYFYDKNGNIRRKNKGGKRP